MFEGRVACARSLEDRFPRWPVVSAEGDAPLEVRAVSVEAAVAFPRGLELLVSRVAGRARTAARHGFEMPTVGYGGAECGEHPPTAGDTHRATVGLTCLNLGGKESHGEAAGGVCSRVARP